MSSSLNLSNNEVGYFNDIYLLKNTGQSSIYEVFGTKTEMSNLAITGLSTLNSTFNSMQIDIDNNSAAVVELSITQHSIITGLSTLNSVLATKANAFDVYDTLWIDEALTKKA